jgi:hypothetical protein
MVGYNSEGIAFLSVPKKPYKNGVWEWVPVQNHEKFENVPTKELKSSKSLTLNFLMKSKKKSGLYSVRDKTYLFDKHEQTLIRVVSSDILVCPDASGEIPQKDSNVLDITSELEDNLPSPAKAATPRIATPPRVTTPRAITPRVTTPRAITPRVTTPRATTPRVTTRFPEFGDTSSDSEEEIETPIATRKSMVKKSSTPKSSKQDTPNEFDYLLPSTPHHNTEASPGLVYALLKDDTPESTPASRKILSQKSTSPGFDAPSFTQDLQSFTDLPSFTQDSPFHGGVSPRLEQISPKSSSKKGSKRRSSILDFSHTDTPSPMNAQIPEIKSDSSMKRMRQELQEMGVNVNTPKTGQTPQTPFSELEVPTFLRSEKKSSSQRSPMTTHQRLSSIGSINHSPEVIRSSLPDAIENRNSLNLSASETQLYNVAMQVIDCMQRVKTRGGCFNELLPYTLRIDNINTSLHRQVLIVDFHHKKTPFVKNLIGLTLQQVLDSGYTIQNRATRKSTNQPVIISKRGASTRDPVLYVLA